MKIFQPLNNDNNPNQSSSINIEDSYFSHNQNSHDIMLDRINSNENNYDNKDNNDNKNNNDTKDNNDNNEINRRSTVNPSSVQSLVFTPHIIEDIEDQMRKSSTPDVLDNTAEMVIQYGYITLFSFVFPLMPLFGVINNYFEIRIDFNNFTTAQRPIPIPSSGIGVWKTVLSLFSTTAIFTNIALICFKTNLLNDFDRQYKIIIFLSSSFVLLLILFIIRLIIPDIPSATKQGIERQQECERFLLVNTETDSDDA